MLLSRFVLAEGRFITQIPALVLSSHHPVLRETGVSPWDSISLTHQDQISASKIQLYEINLMNLYQYFWRNQMNSPQRCTHQKRCGTVLEH